MSKKIKVWLIVAASLVLIGCLIFVGVMTALKWDFKKLSTVKYETNSYTVSEAYENIVITTTTADVVFVPSENDQTSIVCHEQKNAKHAVQVRDGALVIEVADAGKWYEHIGISFDSPKLTVYIPQGAYGSLSIKSDTGKVDIPKEFQFDSMDVAVSTGYVKNYASVQKDLKIKTSTGAILLENVSAGTMSLSVSTGKVEVNKAICDGDVQISVSTGATHINDLKCNNFVSKGSTGDLTMNGMIAAGKLSVERSTGDIYLERSDAAEIFIKTDTGDVKGSLLSDKVFITGTDTGKVEVPRTTTGGKCEITTDTGDIIIRIN